jgi:hypothetical protein
VKEIYYKTNMSNDRIEITLHDFLVQSADSALEHQREDGSFPPGHSYLYNEQATPVRTTAHWLTTLSEVYRITSKERFQDAAIDALEYLLEDEVRPSGYSFHCRNAPNKDNCNGLVGQAYPIRALAHAGDKLNRRDAIKTALEVYELHNFDTNLRLWEVVETDGEVLSFDRTLNHQLAFAAASSNLLEERQSIKSDIQTFIDGLHKNLRTDRRGLIRHYVRPPQMAMIQTVLKKPRHWDMVINEIVFHYYARSSNRRQREIGYQTVNLHWLALLKQRLSKEDYWKTENMKNAINYINSEEYQSMYLEVEEGTATPGIRTAWIEHVLNGVTAKETSQYIEQTLERKLNYDTYLFTSDSGISVDQSAVISFLMGFPNINLSIPIESNNF